MTSNPFVLRQRIQAEIFLNHLFRGGDQSHQDARDDSGTTSSKTMPDPLQGRIFEGPPGCIGSRWDKTCKCWEILATKAPDKAL